MAVPKRKQSHSRTNLRRSQNSKLSVPSMRKCTCGTYNLSHRVCSTCGMYDGKEIIKKDN